MNDLNMLLIATAISGACLSFAMLSYWLGARGGSFLVTWSIGIVVVVAHIVAFWFYARDQVPVIGALANALLPVGAMIVYGSVRQFAEKPRPLAPLLKLAIPYLLVAPPLFLLGLDGVALILQNAVVATLLTLGGLVFWRRRGESPVQTTALAFLYGTSAVSFGLCGAVLLFDGAWHLGAAPSNWAENLNIVVAIVCMSAVGALTLSMDLSRVAGRHRIDALTDAMTGLLNRRGLADLLPHTLGPRWALVLFDLDHFKSVNDIYGHAVGDDVIRSFAAIVLQHRRHSDHGLRLGGEEFALLMENASPEQARFAAESIGAAFAEIVTRPEGMPEFRCTVSAGIAFGDATHPSLDDVLERADKALYAAKRAGRNRVETGELRLVG